jgi:predicted ATPase
VLSLLSHCSQVRCLATSRRRLNVAGERELPVSPLPAPALHRDYDSGTSKALSPEQLVEFDSVRMFVDRAQAARPDFQITARTSSDVGNLCHRLEGLPLAIELLAARAQVLSPHQMVERLERRFEILKSIRSGREARHESLRAAIEWSFDLLSPSLKSLFLSLSVFRGGWTAEAAEAISPGVGSPLEALAHLRSNSLIFTTEAGDEMRYSMLESLAEFAAEQLDSAEAKRLSKAHARYYLELAAEARPHLEGPEHGRWLGKLGYELENLRLALKWCIDEGEGALAVAAGGGLWRFWIEQGHLQEGSEWLSKLVMIPGADTNLYDLAFALNGAGMIAYRLGDFHQAEIRFEKSLAIRREIGDSIGVGGCLHNLGHIFAERGDYAKAHRLYSEAWRLHHELKAHTPEAVALNSLGRVSNLLGEFAKAKSYFEQARNLDRSLGHRAHEAFDVCGLGIVANYEGRHDEAISLFEQSLDLFAGRGHRPAALIGIGVALCRQGHPDRAEAWIVKGLSIHKKIGNKRGIVQGLLAWTELQLAIGDTAAAAFFLGASDALRKQIGSPVPPGDEPIVRRLTESARRSLGHAGYEREHIRGLLIGWKGAVEAVQDSHLHDDQAP